MLLRLHLCDPPHHSLPSVCPSTEDDDNLTADEKALLRFQKQRLKEMSGVVFGGTCCRRRVLAWGEGADQPRRCAAPQGSQQTSAEAPPLRLPEFIQLIDFGGALAPGRLQVHAA